MAEVVNLQEERQQPVPEVVEALELLLHKARCGEVISLAVAASTTGRCTGTLFVIGEGNIADLYLAQERLKQALLDYEGE